MRGRGADCEDCLWRLNIPSLTSLAVINLYLGAGVWHTVAIGGLDRWCDKVCLLRYHTVIKRCAASHGHYNAPATPIILLLLFSTYRQGFNCTFLRKLGEACRAMSQIEKPHTRSHLSWSKSAENTFGWSSSLEKCRTGTSGPVKGLILCWQQKYLKTLFSKKFFSLRHSNKRNK